MACLLPAGGGAAVYWLSQPAGERIAQHDKPAPAPGGIVPFEPFVVNLADAGGGRFLRVGVRLVVDRQETADEVQENELLMVRLRATVLELLAEQTSDQLVTAPGKAALKTAIAKGASAVAAPHKVVDVLFSDFLVQF